MEDKNITEMEAKLRESEEKYRSIFNSLIDVYYQTDAQGTIIDISPSCFIFFGWKREELIGTKTSKLYADPAQRKAFRDKILKDGVVYNYEIMFLHRDGRHIPTLISSRVVKNKNGEIVFVGSVRDITERKHVEDELNKSKEELKLKIEELEKLNGFMMDREMKIIELKNEIAELKKRSE